VVNDGEQALDAFEKERYDIVLLDRNMPELGESRRYGRCAS